MVLFCCRRTCLTSFSITDVRVLIPSLLCYLRCFLTQLLQRRKALAFLLLLFCRDTSSAQLATLARCRGCHVKGNVYNENCFRVPASVHIAKTNLILNLRLQ
jgi:hypothetical protein